VAEEPVDATVVDTEIPVVAVPIDVLSYGEVKPPPPPGLNVVEPTLPLCV
jgi:hypothetical protein